MALKVVGSNPISHPRNEKHRTVLAKAKSVQVSGKDCRKCKSVGQPLHRAVFFIPAAGTPLPASRDVAQLVARVVWERVTAS